MAANIEMKSIEKFHANANFECTLHPLDGWSSLGSEFVKAMRAFTHESIDYFIDEKGNHCLITDTYNEDPVPETTHTVEIYTNENMTTVWFGKNSKHRTRIIIVRATPHAAFAIGKSHIGLSDEVEADVHTFWTNAALSHDETGWLVSHPMWYALRDSPSKYKLIIGSTNNAAIFVHDDGFDGVEMFPIMTPDAAESDLVDAARLAKTFGYETLYYEHPKYPEGVYATFVYALDTVGATRCFGDLTRNLRTDTHYSVLSCGANMVA